jgi:hypothetical protein
LNGDLFILLMLAAITYYCYYSTRKRFCMNIPELQRYRQCQEAEIKLQIEKTRLSWAVAARHEEALVDDKELVDLYKRDKTALIALHLEQLRAAHRMMQGLMTAPQSEVLGKVKTEWPYGHFSIKKRTIWTPDTGDFEADARVWRNKRITSVDTNLSLAYLHSQGTHPNFPDSNRTEEIISTQADDLTFDKHQYIYWTEPLQSAAMRETVAVVCEQAGVEVVESSCSGSSLLR